MTKRSRRDLKRTAAQAVHHLNVYMARVLELKAVFEPVHPEEAERLEQLARGALMVEEGTKLWWEGVWGPFPENLDTWR